MMIRTEWLANFSSSIAPAKRAPLGCDTANASPMVKLMESSSKRQSNQREKILDGCKNMLESESSIRVK